MSKILRAAFTVGMVVTMLSLGVGAGFGSPAPVRETFHTKKTPNVFTIEADPACPIAPGTVTAYETAVGHLWAAGIDEGDPNDPNDDSLVAPAREDLNLNSKVTVVPDDSSFPTLSGSSGFHFAWNVDEGGIGVARIERTIVLKADDGSRFFLHQVGRAVFDLSQINSPNEGLVDIVTDKISCGK
jgi:hypothetical protein